MMVELKEVIIPIFNFNKERERIFQFRVSNNRIVPIKHRKWEMLHLTCKAGQFEVVELLVNNKFNAFSIDLNAPIWNDSF